MIQEKLNEQMNKERQNSAQYAAFAAALEAAGWHGFAAWMERASGEEAEHYKRFRDHLIDLNYIPMLSALEAPVNAGNAPLALFEAALQLERDNTASIIALEEVADTEDDEQTESMLYNWAIPEQTKSVRDLVDRVMELSRVGADGLIILDERYGK